MPATVTPITPRRSSAPAPTPPPPARRPFRDNTRLILAGIAVLALALVAILALANRTPSFSPDYLTEFVLYALSAADLTMLIALAFVLARNIVKLVVERRRGLPFARFRAKLVALLLVMTLVPTTVVLIVGSELILNNIDRWFNAPMDDFLSGANKIAVDYYQERPIPVSDEAARIARALGDADLSSSNVNAIRDLLAPNVTRHAVKMVEVYRVGPAAGGLPRLESVLDLAAPDLPTSYNRAAADRLPAQALRGSTRTRPIQSLRPPGELPHAARVG